MTDLSEFQARHEAIESRRVELLAEVADIIDKADGKPTPGQSQRIANLKKSVEHLADEARELKREERQARIAMVKDFPAAAVIPAVQPRPDFQIKRDVAAFDVDLTRATRGELVDHARAALDVFEERDGITARPLESLDVAMRDRTEAEPMARHLITHGTADYRSAWLKWFNDPKTGPSEFTPEERAAWATARDEVRGQTTGTAATGQVQVPVQIDPAIILQQAGTVDPMLQLADVRPCMTDQLKLVTSLNGVSSEWIAEATQVADATVNDLSQPTVPTWKWDAFVPASIEYLSDVTDAMAELSRLMTDSAANLHATAWIQGTGSNQPTGIVTALSGGSQVVTGTSGATNAQTLVLDDVYKLLEAVPARFRPNASFQAALPTIHSIRKLAAA